MKSIIVKRTFLVLCLCFTFWVSKKVIVFQSHLSPSMLENIEALTQTENGEEKKVGYNGVAEGEDCTITDRIGSTRTGKRVHCYWVGGSSVCFEGACGFPAPGK